MTSDPFAASTLKEMEQFCAQARVAGHGDNAVLYVRTKAFRSKRPLGMRVNTVSVESESETP